MRSDNPQADNLFSRLISYTPRTDRTALEDFCTESLAWCLRCSPEFQSDFLKLVQSKLSKERAPFAIDPTTKSLEVETQYPFSENEATGRFDLRLTDNHTDFILIVEAKVDSPLTDDKEALRKETNESFGKLYQDVFKEWDGTRKVISDIIEKAKAEGKLWLKFFQHGLPTGRIVVHAGFKHSGESFLALFTSGETR